MPGIDKEELFIRMIKEQLNIKVYIKKKPKHQLVIPGGTNSDIRRKIERLYDINFR